MALMNKGLNKLMEECGELVQIAAKKSSYMDTDDHPDGKGLMSTRMEDEMGDVLGAIQAVALLQNLDHNRINERARDKLSLFLKWSKEP